MADTFSAEWAATVTTPRGRPHDPLEFELRTFDPDADDEGRARDYGVSLIEGGVIVGDGSRDGYDTKRLRQIVSLIEHAPDLFNLLEAYVSGNANARHMTRVQQTLAEIRSGDLKYGSWR